MAVTSGNWSFGRGGEPAFADGDTITGGNFTRLRPDTSLCEHVTGLIITGGNWVNVRPQPTWRIEGGNWAQIEFCSHERPDLVERHGLAACAEDCAHRQADVLLDLDADEIDAEIARGRVNPAALLTAQRVDQRNARGLLTAQRLRVSVRQYANRVVKTGPQVLNERAVR